MDDEFIATYRSRDLTAILRDRTPISSEEARFLFPGRVGMLLPVDTAAQSETTVLVPVADKNRQAMLARAEVANRDVASVPMLFSGEELSAVINEIVGQPYGWGGLGGYRDCSSTLLDVFLAFGLPLPQNSSQQADAGEE